MCSSEPLSVMRTALSAGAQVMKCNNSRARFLEFDRNPCRFSCIYTSALTSKSTTDYCRNLISVTVTYK